MAPEKRVVIETHFRVERKELAGRRNYQWIDFQHICIKITHCTVTTSDSFYSVTQLCRFQPQSKSHLPCLKVLEPDSGFNKNLFDCTRICLGQFLDFHATLGRSHHDY